MKTLRSFAAVFLALLPLCGVFAAAEEAVSGDVSAQAAILIEASSGETIFEKNPHEKLPMASTTKIMTALVALEHGDLSKTVHVANGACGVEGSSIYLTAGETLTLEDLLYALMLESANDAAAAIAYEIAGGIEEFAALMNQTAAEIGLTESHFTNPHGLDDEEHYTTAYDLAKLTAYALQNAEFRKIVSTYRHQIPLRGEEGIRVLLNHNKLLRISDDVIGVKTGFTKHSGRCLVSAAERDGVRVIAVTLNAPDDWRDHTMLHELGFASYHLECLAKPGEYTMELPCSGAADGALVLANKDGLSLCLKNGTEVTHVVEAPHVFLPPIDEGDVLGRVVFYADGQPIGEVPLYAQTSVAEAEDTRSPGRKILDLFH
ncbi:MAG: D-alanyl-D-alanine carboxypeptidase family protein [Eubacteriales bacterium]